MCVCVCTYICVATEWFKCHCSFVFCKYQALCYFVRVLLGPTSPAGRQMKKIFSIIKNTDMIKRSGLFLFFVFKLGLKVNFCFCFSCRCYSSYVKELKTSLTVSTHYVVPLSLCPLVFVCISFLQLSFMAHQNKLADSFTFLPHNLIFIQ